MQSDGEQSRVACIQGFIRVEPISPAPEIRVATNARRVLEMKIKMDEIMEISKNVAKKSSRTGKYDTIVFRDGTIAATSGSWEARKPVWCVFSGELDTYEVAAQLIRACIDEDGCPCRPPGYRNWMQEHPEEREKIGSYLFFEPDF